MPKDWVHRPWGKPEKGRKIRTLRKNYFWNSSRPYVACGTTNNDWPGFKRVTSQWASTFYILQFCGVSTNSPPDKDIGVPRDNLHCAAGKGWNLMIAHNWIGQLECTAHHQHQPGIFYILYPWYHPLWWTPTHLNYNTSKDTSAGRPGEAEVHLQDDHLGRRWITTITTTTFNCLWYGHGNWSTSCWCRPSWRIWCAR